MDDLIERWLNAPAHPLALRFPRALEQRFEADTGSERARSLAVYNGLGYLFGCLLYPVFVAGMPDVQVMARHYYLGFSMPLGFLISLALWLRPPPALREGLTLLGNAVCISVCMLIFLRTQSPSLVLAVAGSSILMNYSAIGIQMRFPYAAAALGLLVGLFGFALQIKPGIPAADRIDLVILSAVTACYLLLANWRLERGMRRSYLLTLRERLQRQDLSLRNLELDELARRDPLTGLANRRAYDAWIAAAWAQQAAGRLGLIVLDVDRFKAFNDFYGHAAGDACLKKIALCLREQLRGTTDLVARLGGEEFAVLLPGLAPSICADVADRMRLAVQRLELPHSGLGPHGLVTISAGVASHSVCPTSNAGRLFEAADSALYQAKVSGRNRVCVATLTNAALAEQAS